MNAADFRRIALSLEGAEESSHMGAPDFRVGGRIFVIVIGPSRTICLTTTLWFTPLDPSEGFGSHLKYSSRRSGQ